MMLVVFLLLTDPASRKANPACMTKKIGVINQYCASVGVDKYYCLDYFKDVRSRFRNKILDNFQDKCKYYAVAIYLRIVLLNFHTRDKSGYTNISIPDIPIAI